MKKAKWLLLPLLALAIVGLLIISCNENEKNDSKKLTGISFYLRNGNLNREPSVLPRQLPPGARVVVDARFTGGKAKETFEITWIIDPALGDNIKVTDFKPDYPGLKQIDIATDAPINPNAREWVTFTLTSISDPSITAEWKFVVYGAAVPSGNSFALSDTMYSRLPNLTVAPGDVWEGSVPMSNRYRLAGYPKQVFRYDEDNSALDNECAEYNGTGHISGDDLAMLQAAPKGSLVRLYFSQKAKITTTPEDVDPDADPPITFPGTMIENVPRNGWGVVKFGTMEGETGDGLTAPGHSPAVTYFIDVNFAAALTGMVANNQTEIFVNVFNSSLLMIELWEQIRDITFTNRGDILGEPEVEGGFDLTIDSHPAAFALLKSANEGSYMLITMESPEVRPGWNIMQIGSSFGSTGKYSEMPIPPTVTTLPSGWILFTNRWDLVSVLKKAELHPLTDDMVIKFNIWMQSETSTTIPGQSGFPKLLTIELWTIDD